MAKTTSEQSAPKIRFTATLFRPAGKRVSWFFLTLPKRASAKLPSRGQVTVEGAINGAPFRATLQPDGEGGHWLKVDRKMREAAGAHGMNVGEKVTLTVTPVPPDKEPEPKVPADLRKALAAAPQKVKDVWSDITPIARRDWIAWIVSAKQAETRARRISNACDMLSKGKRRPCCFDRSGMYSGGGKSMRCPVAAPIRPQNKPKIARANMARFQKRWIRIREFVEQLPGGRAVEHGKHLSLEVKRKRFGWLLDDHHGDGRLALHCKSNKALCERLNTNAPASFHVPKHVGHHGWVGLWLDAAGRLDWSLIEAAVIGAYRLTAPNSLTAQLTDRLARGHSPAESDNKRYSQ